MTMVVSNAQGQTSGENKYEKFETPIDVAGNIADIAAKFTPVNGNVHITYFMNGVQIAEWDTTIPYENLAGPRSGWLFQCYPDGGIKATLPTVTTLSKEIGLMVLDMDLL